MAALVARAIPDAILNALVKHEERRVDELDAELAALIFDATPRDGRVVTNALIPTGQGYMIPGRLMADGKARLVVNPAQRVNEAGIDWPDA